MTINIRTTTKPFQNNKVVECSRIIRDIAVQLLDGKYPLKGKPINIYDSHGNLVGTWRR